MYNRYVPGHNGVYERQTIPDPSSKMKPDEPICQEEKHVKTEIAQQQNCPDQSAFLGLDLGDLLLLCIVFLLVVEADEDDILPLLIMAAVFLLQQ